MGRKKPAAGARCSARVRPLRAAQREDASVRRIRLAPCAAAQMDAADLLQRAGGNLPRLNGRNSTGEGGASPYRPLHRSAVRHSQRPHLATLHGGVAFLRRPGVARVSGGRQAFVVAGLAWLAHLYTASSAVIALLATIAVFEYRFRAAFLWLALAIIVDSSDGVLARAVRVKQRLPWFNGAKLDDIVDYLTYVFVP